MNSHGISIISQYSCKAKSTSTNGQLFGSSSGMLVCIKLCQKYFDLTQIQTYINWPVYSNDIYFNSKCPCVSAIISEKYEWFEKIKVQGAQFCQTSFNHHQIRTWLGYSHDVPSYQISFDCVHLKQR